MSNKLKAAGYLESYDIHASYKDDVYFNKATFYPMAIAIPLGALFILLVVLGVLAAQVFSA